jgi:hypothetical protein
VSGALGTTLLVRCTGGLCVAVELGFSHELHARLPDPTDFSPDELRRCQANYAALACVEWFSKPSRPNAALTSLVCSGPLAIDLHLFVNILHRFVRSYEAPLGGEGLLKCWLTGNLRSICMVVVFHSCFARRRLPTATHGAIVPEQ